MIKVDGSNSLKKLIRLIIVYLDHFTITLRVSNIVRRDLQM